MRCFLVRHAHTTWNGQNRFLGHTDRPLSPLGLRQAEQVSRYFAALKASGVSFGALYTSQLTRSVQTAEAIAQQTGLSPRRVPALAEIHLGVWEGLTGAEVDTRFNGDYQKWRIHPSQVTIPQGEPVEEFRARVREGFRRVIARCCEGACVVVSHGGVISAWLADWLGADYDQVLQTLVLDNAGISIVDCHTDPPCVLAINMTEHLQSDTQTHPTSSAIVTP